MTTNQRPRNCDTSLYYVIVGKKGRLDLTRTVVFYFLDFLKIIFDIHNCI